MLNKGYNILTFDFDNSFDLQILNNDIITALAALRGYSEWILSVLEKKGSALPSQSHSLELGNPFFLNLFTKN